MSTARHRLLLIGTVALTAAACAQEEGAPPASPAPTVSTTTLPPPTTAPVTTIATTTTEATTTTTTTVPPTTAPPVPTGDPTDAATPVFAGSSGDAWLYVGRWSGTGWEQAFDSGGAPVPYDLPAGIDVSISEVGQTPVAGVTGDAGEACVDEGFGATPGPVITPNAGVPDVPGFGYRSIGLPTAWEIRPRDVVQIDDRIPAYASAGVAAFADTGVETQAGEIDQTVISDLDGDGDTEVLVVFGHENERVEGETSPPGGYSALLLIDADTQAATEIAKSFTPVVAAGDGADDADGEIVQPFDSYRVMDVLDLNGDGISEVAVHTWFTGGASVSIYSYDGATLTEVLVAGCGV